MAETAKNALVTGASGVIGAAIARKLAGQGYAVTLHAGRRRDRVDQLRDELLAAGAAADSISFDVADTDQCQEVLGPLAQRPYQIVVSNAGIHDDAPLAGMTAGQWKRVVDVSLNGFYNVVHPLLLPMMRTRWGRIIAISSVAGVLGNRGQANYAAAKAGLHGAVKSLAIECASRGITVNAVAPGVIHSDETDQIFPKEKLKAMVPMQRAGRPEEVADLVGFLASEQSGYISGQVISINGAMGG